MSSQGWIGVDLDGTLAEYAGWQGVDHIGPPIPAMVARVKAWLAEGREVRIFTARIYCGVYPPTGGAYDAEAALRTRVAIATWCEQHLGRVLPVTCVKDFAMIELWDDRAVQVVTNTGARVGTQPTADHLATAPEEVA